MEFILSMSLGINLLLLIFAAKILKKNVANIFLLALLSFVLLGTAFAVLLLHVKMQTSILTHIVNAMPTMTGGFTYLYVYYSIHSDQKFRSSSLLHLLPLLFSIPLSYYDFKGIMLISVIFNLGFKIIISMVYFYFSLRIIEKHSMLIQNHFSKTDKIDLKWLAFIVKIGLIIYVVYFLIMLVWVFDNQWIDKLETIPNNLVLAYILAISYYSLSSTKVFEQISEFQIERNVASNDLLNGSDLEMNYPDKKELMTEEKSQLLCLQIKQLIEKGELYKNENLKIEDLARELKLHSKYISYVINRVEGKNFFDFINHYRILAFNIEVLKHHNKKLTYLSIAYNCGFGSKSAFNRVYKNQMGISPSEYIKKQNSELN